MTSVSAATALQRLKAGNLRFVSRIGRGRRSLPAHELFDVSKEQRPFAVILGCSDSRVPAEIVFDQGFGDLFVIRVAGNIVAPSQVGSVEFAAASLGTRLVVVLGHSRCGAILTTLKEIRRPARNQSRNIASIVERIRPSVEPLAKSARGRGSDGLIRACVRANIVASASHLRHGSEVLERFIRKDGLAVVGAEYSLETGRVEFFDGID